MPIAQGSPKCRPVRVLPSVLDVLEQSVSGFNVSIKAFFQPHKLLTVTCHLQVEGRKHRKKRERRYHYFLRTSHFSFDEVQRGREGAREDVWIRTRARHRGGKKVTAPPPRATRTDINSSETFLQLSCQ